MCIHLQRSHLRATRTTKSILSDKFQQFLLISIACQVPALVSGTDDVGHVSHNLVTRLVLQIDAGPIAHTLGQNTRLNRVSRRIAAGSVCRPRRSHNKGLTRILWSLCLDRAWWSDTLLTVNATTCRSTRPIACSSKLCLKTGSSRWTTLHEVKVNPELKSKL